MISFEAAVSEAKKIIAGENTSAWRLGDLANDIEPKYGDQTLKKFAEVIGIDHGTLKSYRTTVRAWAQKAGRPAFSVCETLNNHPDRIAIVQNNPKMTRSEARQIMKEHNGPPRKSRKEREDRAAILLAEGKTTREIAAALGCGERQACQVIEHVKIIQETRKQVLEEEPPIDVSTLSKTAQQKLDAAMRQYQRGLDAKFEDAVQREMKRRAEEMMLPQFDRDREELMWTLKARNAIFTLTEYNAILRCVHPDLNPTIEQKNEAFRLLHEHKLVLLSQEDDPRSYPPIPTIDEFMAGTRKRA